VLLQRGFDRQRHQWFATSSWPGYPVVNATLLGSKSAGPLAAAWAIASVLGVDGFRMLTASMAASVARITTAVHAIEGLRIVGDPTGPMVALAADETDAARRVDPHLWADAMREFGFVVQGQPASAQPDGSVRFGRPPLAMVPLVLDHNLRNTRQIAQTFVPLAPTSMVLRGGDGPEVEFVPVTTTDAIEAADDQIDRLIDEGWEPKDIALLTMGARHPVQRERQEALGFAAYWDEFWSNEDVFYGHVLGFKGMERRAVVLCVNEDGTRERSGERLYVGMSRATDRLVVVASPEVIRSIGGPEVLERLRPT